MEYYSFDIVITTYNRPSQVYSLVEDLLSCDKPLPQKIIVVDSSDSENLLFRNMKNVIYVRSTHKNQPYQRFLGVQFVCSDVVLFLDDDLTIIDRSSFFETLLCLYGEDNNIVGASVGLNMENGIHANLGGVSLPKNNRLFKLLWSLTGVSIVKKGGIGGLGIAGIKDETTKFVESFSGAVMSFRSSIVPNLFDETLFYLFENRLAMGEDKYISMGALKYGKLAYEHTYCLLHPANESSYFVNIEEFSKKELFSRIWLSMKYAKVKNKSICMIYFQYYWFAIIRILFSLFEFMLNPGKRKLEKLKGRSSAMMLSLSEIEKKASEYNWFLDIDTDKKKYAISEEANRI